jgi:hypothetical protein
VPAANRNIGGLKVVADRAYQSAALRHAVDQFGYRAIFRASRATLVNSLMKILTAKAITIALCGTQEAYSRAGRGSAY